MVYINRSALRMLMLAFFGAAAVSMVMATPARRGPIDDVISASNGSSNSSNSSNSTLPVIGTNATNGSVNGTGRGGNCRQQQSSQNFSVNSTTFVLNNTNLGFWISLGEGKNNVGNSGVNSSNGSNSSNSSNSTNNNTRRAVDYDAYGFEIEDTAEILQDDSSSVNASQSAKNKILFNVQNLTLSQGGQQVVIVPDQNIQVSPIGNKCNVTSISAIGNQSVNGSQVSYAIVLTNNDTNATVFNRRRINANDVIGYWNFSNLSLGSSGNSSNGSNATNGSGNATASQSGNGSNSSVSMNLTVVVSGQNLSVQNVSNNTISITSNDQVFFLNISDFFVFNTSSSTFNSSNIIISFPGLNSSNSSNGSVGASGNSSNSSNSSNGSVGASGNSSNSSNSSNGSVGASGRKNNNTTNQIIIVMSVNATGLNQPFGMSSSFLISQGSNSSNSSNSSGSADQGQPEAEPNGAMTQMVSSIAFLLVAGLVAVQHAF